MKKHELCYRIFKEVYNYRELELNNGLILYDVRDERLYIAEMIADGKDSHFLAEMANSVNMLLSQHGLKIIETYINQEKNKKLLAFMLKHGFEVLSVSGKYIKIARSM